MCVVVHGDGIISIDVPRFSRDVAMTATVGPSSPSFQYKKTNGKKARMHRRFFSFQVGNAITTSVSLHGYYVSTYRVCAVCVYLSSGVSNDLLSFSVSLFGLFSSNPIENN